MPLNLFDLSLRLSGYDIRAAKKKMDAWRQLSPKKLMEIRNQQRHKIVQYHLKNTRFYADFTHLNRAESWEQLPVLTKSDLQQPLEHILSKGFSNKNVYVGKTSGSSGQPFIFAKDHWCHALSWASFYKYYAQQDIDLSGDRQARFYGIPQRGKDKYKERLKDFISNRYRFDIFDLSPENLEKFLIRFKKTPFVYINGYTSSILFFTKFLQGRNIILKEVCKTLKACIVTSEMLFETDRQLMENYLGVPIINEYGASENGLIAFENSQKQLKIDEDLLYVEIVDEDGKPLPHGEKGRIVITSLYNRAQAFIRYAIGDLGILTRNPGNGDLILKELSGRTNDFVKLPSGKTVPGLAFYYVTKTAMESTANVKEFVVTQTNLTHFEVVYVSDRALSGNEETAIIKTMSAYLEQGLTINLERVEQLQRSLSGKLKQFISKL